MVAPDITNDSTILTNITTQKINSFDIWSRDFMFKLQFIVCIIMCQRCEFIWPMIAHRYWLQMIAAYCLFCDFVLTLCDFDHIFCEINWTLVYMSQTFDQNSFILKKFSNCLEIKFSSSILLFPSSMQMLKCFVSWICPFGIHVFLCSIKSNKATTHVRIDTQTHDVRINTPLNPITFPSDRVLHFLS